MNEKIKKFLDQVFFLFFIEYNEDLLTKFGVRNGMKITLRCCPGMTKPQVTSSMYSTCRTKKNLGYSLLLLARFHR